MSENHLEIFRYAAFAVRRSSLSFTFKDFPELRGRLSHSCQQIGLPLFHPVPNEFRHVLVLTDIRRGVNQHRHVLSFLSASSANRAGRQKPQGRLLKALGHFGMEGLLVFWRGWPQPIRLVLVKDADHVSLVTIRFCAVGPEDFTRSEIAERSVECCYEIARVEVVKIFIQAVRIGVDENVGEGGGGVAHIGHCRQGCQDPPYGGIYLGHVVIAACRIY